MEVWQIDLSSFASLRAFADRFEKEGSGKLDLLVENAGINVVDQKFKPTDDRYEQT